MVLLLLLVHVRLNRPHLIRRFSLAPPLEVEHPETYQVQRRQSKHRRLVYLQHLYFQQRNVQNKFSEKPVAILYVDEIGEDLEEAARTWKLQVKVDAYQGLRF